MHRHLCCSSFQLMVQQQTMYPPFCFFSSSSRSLFAFSAAASSSWTRGHGHVRGVMSKGLLKQVTCLTRQVVDACPKLSVRWMCTHETTAHAPATPINNTLCEDVKVNGCSHNTCVSSSSHCTLPQTRKQWHRSNAAVETTGLERAMQNINTGSRLRLKDF